jgi:hypothetical protein
MKRNAEIGLFAKSSNDPGPMLSSASAARSWHHLAAPPPGTPQTQNAFPTVAWLQKYLKFAPVRPIDNPKPSAAGTVVGRSLGAAMRRVAGKTHNLIYYI